MNAKYISDATDAIRETIIATMPGTAAANGMTGPLPTRAEPLRSGRAAWCRTAAERRVDATQRGTVSTRAPERQAVRPCGAGRDDPAGHGVLEEHGVATVLMILDAVRDVLEPTRTYNVREFIWIPADPQNPEADGRDGNLTLKLQFRRGVHRKYDLDSYAVERDHNQEPGDNGGRAFWLVNLTDRTQEQPYRCVVGGLTPKCDCKAGKCKVTDEEGSLCCKHYSSLKRLTDEWGL